MSNDIEEKNKNLELFNDIINGYSEYKTDFGDVYFKHLDTLQYQKNISHYTQLLKEIEAEGILSENEQIENAYNQGLWSKDQENQISRIANSISRLKETKKKLIYKSDKERIEEQITEQKKLLYDLDAKKREFLVLTSEQVSIKKSTDFYIKNFIFKDKNLTVKFFNSDNDFEFADDICIEVLTSLYSKYLENTSVFFIKKLALSTDFQNLLFVSDKPIDVFGKPIVKLTKNQIDLLIWGKYFKNIIQNTTRDIPEGLSDNPDKFLEWIDGLKEKKQSKAKKSQKSDKNSSKFLFGSSDEIKSMTGQEISGNKILKEASEKGTLNMNDLMEKQA